MDDDYIKELTKEEKIVFLRLLCKIIKADNVIDANEIGILKEVAERYGIDSSTMINIIKENNSVNITAEAAKILNRKHALQLIKEMCVIANVDDDLNDDELDIIIDTARAMNIEDDKIILINRWVLDSMILSKTGNSGQKCRNLCKIIGNFKR